LLSFNSVADFYFNVVWLTIVWPLLSFWSRFKYLCVISYHLICSSNCKSHV